MPATDAASSATHEAEAPDEPRKVGRFDWADPEVPAGDSPHLARLIRRRVRLMAPSRETLSITSIECDNPAIKASVDKDQVRQYKHIVQLIVELSGRLPAGRHRATLTVRTTVPDAEKLEIPVTVFVTGS